jgi:hypothetical protein
MSLRRLTYLSVLCIRLTCTETISHAQPDADRGSQIAAATRSEHSKCGKQGRRESMQCRDISPFVPRVRIMEQHTYGKLGRMPTNLGTVEQADCMLGEGSELGVRLGRKGEARRREPKVAMGGPDGSAVKD